MLTSCGNAPDYRFEKSEDTCMLSFSFETGIINKKTIGSFNLISTLQYLDSNPELEIFIGEPSHLNLEIGSVQKIEIDGQLFTPQFHQNYLRPEYQYWGPAFTFDKKLSKVVYQKLLSGLDMNIYGRIEVGSQYQVRIKSHSFKDNDEIFNNCINRLLSGDDIKKMLHQKRNSLPPEISVASFEF